MTTSTMEGGRKRVYDTTGEQTVHKSSLIATFSMQFLNNFFSRLVLKRFSGAGKFVIVAEDCVLRPPYKRYKGTSAYFNNLIPSTSVCN